MANYIVLVNWTGQGIKNVKDTVKRAKSFENAIEKAGGKSLGFYYTIGRYDMVAMVEAPNDEAIASVLYSTGSLGNVRTETLKAFSMDEAANIIESSLSRQYNNNNVFCLSIFYLAIHPFSVCYLLNT
jgi:uncharacterized protein with GYD domain